MKVSRLAALACVGFIVLVVGAQPAVATSSTLVISQVYGGGGNAGATLKNDFMELHNRGTTAVDVTGWSVQYASSAGVNWTVTTLSGTILPGRYYLIRQAAQGGGTVDLPNADAIGTTAMSATAGKVVLVMNNTMIPAGTSCPSGVVDLVGYGSAANCFEGAGPTATLSNTTAALRNGDGCTETDNNNADFTVGSPNPRNRFADPHFCDAENAPSVVSTTPSNGAAGVARGANITINFSEPVDVSGSWYSISCGTSGSHTATVSGGPTTYTVDPDSDYAFSETCTTTVFASQVSDQDLLDPPDNMSADHSFAFSTEAPPPPLRQISEIQGASHTSPHNGELVSVEGVVIAERGSNVWLQDPTPDSNPDTSEGILVFGSTVANAVVVGDHVNVRGTVTEFRAGCTPSCAPTASAFDNLTITEIAAPGLGVSKLGTLPPPAATVIGLGGRVPPTEVIENDSSSGNVEASNVFDPAQDGIDFYETLESMLVQVNNPVAAGPRNNFGEIVVLPDDGAGASIRTARGGILVRDVDAGTLGDYRMGDFNPERVMLDDLFMPTPSVDVADHFTTSAAGVLTYDFANFKIAVTSALTAVDGGLEREITRAPLDREIVVGTYNVENLDPTDGSFARHADLIVNNLRSPDLLAIEEIQDNNGAANDSVTDASVTWNALIAAIQAAGGPAYEYRQIDPVDDQDGGQPGGNIRVGFLFRTDRGLSFIDRPGGDSTTPTTVVDTRSGARLSFSPGRVDPMNPAFFDSRKPLVGEFRMHGKKVFVIANHLSSKGGDDPLFGRFQPPERSSEVARHAQAQVLNDFVDEIKAADRSANVIVLGDINDFEFSQTVDILEGDVLSSLMNTLPQSERYSYVFEGNSQVLDQILVSNSMLGNFPIDYDPVHVNSEFADQASDHDPQVARIDFRGRPSRR